ncbi:sugar transferase [Saccharopolyspora mangrovi]|uniref:Sugar transferase n=1 Tax=Saccharopolyspora mangrovi TaxID=3082379 RepID=A0ABU6A4X8_9PSEU|nr:sugar transferase [Saccharopolyspora sp. S2-29]MEB3366465.1 sugar transferase [Saccharopolyspora sp. S2-29]
MLDVLAVLVAGLVIVPLCLVIALVILCTMGGPVMFRQTRSGKYGDSFEILKFRTMHVCTDGGQSDAQRQTAVGRFLRQFSLDEWPQLWNVLRGDMSLIGPRPTLPEQVERYSIRQRGRLDVLPGLTGWAQVQGRNSLSWAQRIELDLWYIENRSVRLDLWIVALTIAQLVRPRGVVGHSAGNSGSPQADELSQQAGNSQPEVVKMTEEGLTLSSPDKDRSSTQSGSEMRIARTNTPTERLRTGASK